MVKSDDAAARLWKAESVVALLAKLDVDKLPPGESEAVGKCQADAMEEWLGAYVDMRKDDADFAGSPSAGSASGALAPARRCFD